MHKNQRGAYEQYLAEHREVFDGLEDYYDVTNEAACLIAEAFKANKKLLVCGNGGSAADSQHIAAEMVGRFSRDRKPLPAISLTTDTSALTCIANDYSYQDVFARQVDAIGHSGDVLLAISTSGNSINVLKAVDVAKSKGILTIGLLGRDGGSIGGHIDLGIVVPSDATPRIQEAHIFIGHVLCSLVEIEMGLV